MVLCLISQPPFCFCKDFVYFVYFVVSQLSFSGPCNPIPAEQFRLLQHRQGCLLLLVGRIPED
jgi:hypothetical protein